MIPITNLGNSFGAKGLRLVLMSDTHDHHREVAVPDGDLLIHAGDFTFFNGSTHAIRDFNDWLGQLPHPFKVLIPGNHDSGFADPVWRGLITNAKLLINEGTVTAGLRIWGSPVTPNDWGAFGPTSARERGQLFARIPQDTAVLVTHGPPRGVLDAPSHGDPQGCEQLLAAVRRVKPPLHVFGHVHQRYGTSHSAGTLFANAALAGTDYNMANRPIVIDIDRIWD